jgi:hypothetical protein
MLEFRLQAVVLNNWVVATLARAWANDSTPTVWRPWLPENLASTKVWDS